ncbi:MAG: hypothetical protein WDN03_02190 [Rhizomicrobium sp.]
MQALCGPAGRLKVAIKRVDEILRFVGPQEDRPVRMLARQLVAREHGTLPHELEQLLRDDAVLVPCQRRHIHDDDRAVERQFRHERRLGTEGVKEDARD